MITKETIQAYDLKRWEIIRTKGKSGYVARIGLIFGAAGVILNFIFSVAFVLLWQGGGFIDILISPGFILFSVAVAATFILSGLGIGNLIWNMHEKEFRRKSGEKTILHFLN